jgi:molybdopterin synthase catalytic subunit
MPHTGIHRKGEIDFFGLLSELRRNLPEDVGAIGCFIGVVRGVSDGKEKVVWLKYESAEEDAAKTLHNIAEDFEKREGIKKVMIHHIIDALKPGEDAIYVLVAGRGRKDVFRALEEIMDRVKVEALVWKKEVTESREYWSYEIREPKDSAH